MIPGTLDVPHIKVEVIYRDQMVSLNTTHFMEGVEFLGDAERAIRYGLNLPNGKDVDDDTSERIDHNRKLLFGPPPVDIQGEPNEQETQN